LFDFFIYTDHVRSGFFPPRPGLSVLTQQQQLQQQCWSPLHFLDICFWKDSFLLFIRVSRGSPERRDGMRIRQTARTYRIKKLTKLSCKNLRHQSRALLSSKTIYLCRIIQKAFKMSFAHHCTPFTSKESDVTKEGAFSEAS
jgi:hypothetical protein